MNRKLEEKLERYNQSFTRSEKLIAHTISHNKVPKEDFTVRNVAKYSYCSPTLINKFIRKIGYESFYEIKHDYLLAKEDESNKHIIEYFNKIDKASDKQILTINKINNLIEEYCNILVVGSGYSSVAAMNLYKRLLRKYDSSAKVINILYEDHHRYDYKENTLYIFISNSGESRELISLTGKLESGFILITNADNSSLACMSREFVTGGFSKEHFRVAKEDPKLTKYLLAYFVDKVIK